MSSFVLRLCLLMVAAFGSRPCGVHKVEQPRSGSVAHVRERRLVDEGTGSRIPAPALRLPVRAVAGLRAPTTPTSGGANATPLALAARAAGLGARFTGAAIVVRRTPCAACGDGSPYYATAPPASSARA